MPKITAGGVLLGSPISNAGNWIRPPPPTTASTHPATKAATIRAASDRVERSSTPKASGVMQCGKDLGQRVFDCDLDPLATPSIAYLDHAVREAATNHNDRGHAEDF